jgi:hypothetical protein
MAAAAGMGAVVSIQGAYRAPGSLAFIIAALGLVLYSIAIILIRMDRDEKRNNVYWWQFALTLPAVMIALTLWPDPDMHWVVVGLCVLAATLGTFSTLLHKARLVLEEWVVTLLPLLITRTHDFN